VYHMQRPPQLIIGPDCNNTIFVIKLLCACNIFHRLLIVRYGYVKKQEYAHNGQNANAK
jgi:hypothetical protein